MSLVCNKRIRDIDPKEFSKSGRIISEKQKKVIEFESNLERDFIHLLEFDIKVNKYVEQPLSIRVVNGKNEYDYTPDFYVEYINNYKVPEIIELKFESDLNKNYKKWKAKFDAAENFCKLNNLNFKIITEKEVRLNMTYLENLKLLGNYVNAIDGYSTHNKCNIDATHMKGIHTQILLEGPDSIENHVKRYIEDDQIRCEVFFWIYHMLSKALIHTDLNTPISKKSLIWG